MKMKMYLLALLLVLGASGFAQEQEEKSVYGGGSVGFGMRSTVNMFGDNEVNGIGAGGHFKLGFGPRVNTEWFLDLISSSSDLNDLTPSGGYDIQRNDYHIGWAVQFALMKKGFGDGLVPYVMGGQCFDLTSMGYKGYGDASGIANNSPLVFSAAAQVGAGLSYFIGRRVEFNLQTQYMSHISGHTQIEFADPFQPDIHSEKSMSLKGHFLVTGSFNVYFLRLWKK